MNRHLLKRNIQIADKENADFIAMTSHGDGGLTRVSYGSVAAGVLYRVDLPLLVIRSRKEYWQFEHPERLLDLIVIPGE